MTARKHHTVPQSLLRRFAVSEEREQVWVYDKQENRAFIAAIKDTGAERDFYAVGTGKSRVTWEPSFQALDGRLAAVLRDLIDAEGLTDLDADVLADIPMLTAIQLLRTQLQRSSIPAFVAQLNSVLESSGADPLAISDDETRLIHLKRLLGVSALADVLAGKDVLLLRSVEPEGELWISDNPVVLHNTFPYGEVGVSSPGVEIYFPISPTRCLALYCPSIGEQIAESLDPHHPRPALSDPWYLHLLQGIQLGTAVSIGRDFATFLNELQIRRSTRFLYSAQPRYTFAESVLAARPALRRIESLSNLGELGAGPPPFEGMPLGSFLLLETGYRHHVLAVTDRTPMTVEGCMEVQVVDRAKLASIGTGASFDAATLIVDGQATRHMRDVVLEPEGANGDDVFLVRHADSGLRALFESLDRSES